MPEYQFDRDGQVNIPCPVSWAPQAESIVRWSDLDAFEAAYIEAAFWTSELGDVGFDDIAPDALRAIIADCAAWQEAHEALLERAYDADGYGGPEQAGHDYWLTRNGHGAGFWDRGLGRIGEALSEAARAAGSADLYLGDDGRVYVA